MADKVFVIGDEETVVGFNLLGVDGITPEDFEQQGFELLARAGIGLLVIQKPFVEKASLKLRKALDSSTKPVVLVISGRNALESGGSDELAKMVKKIIGI